MIEAIADVLISIVAGFVELVIRMLALVLRSSYLIQYTKGLNRYAHIAAVVLGGYLLFGIARAMFDGLATPVLQPLFAWPVVVVVIFFMLVAFAVPEAAREIAVPERKAARKQEPEMLWPLAFMLSAVLVLGGISLWSGEVHRRTLAERACDAANARVSAELRDTAEKGLALTNRLLKREKPMVLPCAE